MPTLLSQFVPAFPSPAVSTSPFSASVSLFLPWNRFIGITFLDSIMCVCVCDPPHYNLLKYVPFYGWVTFHCVYVPQILYLFLCQWTSSLLPCPGYYKQCCHEHWGYMCLSEFLLFGSVRFSLLFITGYMYKCYIGIKKYIFYKYFSYMFDIFLLVQQ